MEESWRHCLVGWIFWACRAMLWKKSRL